jgi:glycosyltransferase involved in cell wall biosynthesis
MAYGKVVLSSVQGGQAEIVQDGINGFLFDHNDPITFFNKVRQVVDLTPHDIDRISAAAKRTIVDKCDPSFYYKQKIDSLNKSVINDVGFPFVVSTGVKQWSANDTGNGLLSVVIPYYNMGELIYETIESILRADYKQVEIIIINDGSNDEESLNVLKKLRVRKDLTLIDQQNKGLPAARNVGAAYAKGEFLTFLDSDDLVARTYYSKAITVLQTKVNVHFVGSWIQYFGDSKAIWPSFNPEPPYLLYHNMVNSSSLVFRRNAFVNAGLNDERFIYGMEDYDATINLVKNGYRGVILPEILFFYRVRKNSMARGFNREINVYLYGLLAEKHKHLYATFATEITNLLNANGPGYRIDNPSLDYLLYGSPSLKGRMIKAAIRIVKRQPKLKRIAIFIKRKMNS